MKQIAHFIQGVLFVPGIILGFLAAAIGAGIDTGHEIFNQATGEK